MTNFNRRVAYQKKTNPKTAEFQPNRLKYANVKDAIVTRQDYNRAIKRMEKYNAKTAVVIEPKKGVFTTKWFDTEAKIEKKRQLKENRKKLEEIGEEEVKVGGVGQGSKRKEMGRIEDTLRTTEIDWKAKTPKEYVYALRSVDLHLDANATLEKQKLMRENYISGLTEHGFIDAAPELIQYIEGVDFDTFYKTQQTDDTATFAWYRDPQGFDIRLDYMLRSWRAAFESYQENKAGAFVKDK